VERETLELLRRSSSYSGERCTIHKHMDDSEAGSKASK